MNSTPSEVSSSVFFSVADINSTVYFRHPFHSLTGPKSLSEFTVMDIEPVPFPELPSFPGQGATSEKVI